MEITDSLRIGHPEIDALHERLAELAGRCGEFIRVGDKTSCAATIRELRRVMLEHFDVEIRVMKELGYLQIEDHQGSHGNAGARFRKIMNCCTAEDCPGDECLAEINSLLFDDLLKSDMNFKSYLQQINYR